MILTKGIIKADIINWKVGYILFHMKSKFKLSEMFFRFAKKKPKRATGI